MEEIIVGVVGVLQFDVLKYRLENEYNVEIRLRSFHMSISAGLKIKILIWTSLPELPI